jgi:hypothetical protein
LQDFRKLIRRIYFDPRLIISSACFSDRIALLAWQRERLKLKFRLYVSHIRDKMKGSSSVRAAYEIEHARDK